MIKLCILDRRVTDIIGDHMSNRWLKLCIEDREKVIHVEVLILIL